MFIAACTGEDETVLHQSFDIAYQDLEAMVEDYPEQISGAVLADPAGFLERVEDILAEPPDLFIVADKQHDIGEGYVPDDLVDLGDFDILVNRPGLQLRSLVMPDVLAMATAAEIDGITLVFSSAYRSYDYQKAVYERNVRQLGQEQADRESARPGTSQHQLGTTVDFGSITDAFAETPAGKWLLENAWRYGFSLSYPDGYESLTGYRHEIWHYRYISRAAARLERDYFGSIQHYLLVFLADHLETLRAAHRPGGGGPAAIREEGSGVGGPT